MMKTKNLILFLFIAMTASAQKQFTLEDLNFGGNNYHNMVPKNRYTAWWGDELVHTDHDRCTLIDKKTGKESLLFTLETLNSHGCVTANGHKIKSLSNATFPYSGQPLVLVSNGTDRILFDWKQQKRVWSQSCADETHAEWNAASRAVAFVKNHNLYLTDAQGKTHQLTTDGSRDIVYGQIVNRNEFGIYKGTFWSNDGQQLAFYRMDQSMVTDYPLVNINTRIATLEPEKYPMAGETIHQVKVGIYNLKTGRTIYLNTGDPTDRYFTNICWSPDNRLLYLIELNRKQSDFSLDVYDATTGNKVSTLYREHSEKYVHPVNPITFLPWDASKFILQSEKDGFNHLYLFNIKGQQLKQITSGKWLVLDLMGFNPARKEAIILSNECNPIQNNIFAVHIQSGKRRLLDNGKGCHANIYEPDGGHKLALSPGGNWIIDNFTAPETPRNIDIIHVATARKQSYFKAEDPWIGYQVPEYSCGTLKAADGKTDLYYRMVKPVNFDSKKKYPTIIYVYGGPGTRNVEARWHYMSRGWETYMAQKGYLLFILDNRGSCNRGRDFEQATFHHLGIEEMKDQMRGVEYLKSLPYVDTNRMGIHGWSFGGFMTTNLMTTHPEVFKVGVAGGPVIDWKWYEAMYGERYMGTPQSNPQGFAESSLLSKAKNLKGKLQIIIGMNDPVVLPQHALNFLQACIQVGTQPDFFVYPGEPHNMRGHQSTHLHERISQYFDDYLK
ncbi:S9 family peptidase [Hoylesella enoeca]|uniref:S9 family peptidase n=1 Tax=Hoylesella enoeca TaxID=76123 RepID=UPI0035D11801